jgi:hypothetical protein
MRSKADIDSRPYCAIHPWGELFKRTVLGKCNKFGIDKEEGPCFLYAINNNVVLPEHITHPK